MRRLLSMLVLVLTVGLNSVHAQSSSSADDRLIGTWSGTYAGDGTGKFTMAFSRDAAKRITGTVDASPDSGSGYTATFKSIVVDGASVKMAYDEPDNSAMEIQLEATLDGDSMTGTWKSLDTGAKSVVASGTFTGSKH
jgi:hypothetical protein